MKVSASKNPSKKQTARFVFLGLLFSSFALLAFLFAIETANIGRVVRGVKIAGIGLSGIKETEAEKILEEKFGNFLDSSLVLVYENQKWTTTPRNTGFLLSAGENSRKAYGYGRNKNILSGIREQTVSFFRGKNLKPACSFDENKLNEFIGNNLSEIETPAVNAAPVFNKKTGTFVSSLSSEGKIIDKNILEKDIISCAYELDCSAINLVLTEDSPAITEADAEYARNLAQIIADYAPYSVSFENNEWIIDKKTVVEWIEFSSSEPHRLAVSFDEESLDNFLSVLAPSVSRRSSNARLAIAEEKIIISVPSKNETVLNIEESAKKITNTLINFPSAYSRTNENSEARIELVISEKPPLITAETIEQYGLKNLLAKGESNFAGSPANRKHNIQTGAAKFDSLLIAPGEEFSFNVNLGEVGPKEGYLPELVIKTDKTVPEYGGGICQVSTTLFRAAVNAGLKITERYPHAFPVAYYNPQGFDATVYPPHPDMRFINNTPNYILVQNKIEGTKLTFELYGANDGWEVKIKGPYILSKSSDGSMKTVLTQEIYRDGNLEEKKSFYSNYRSPSLFPVEKNPLE